MGTWGRQRVIKKICKIPGIHGEAIGFISETKDTELELDFLDSTIELGNFCPMEHFSENIWKLPQLLTAFHALFHPILPIPWDGYYFIPIWLTRKLKPRMVSTLLKSQSQAGFNPGSVIANPMPSATTSSTPCCYWQFADAGQAACPPTTEEVKWNSASDSSLNSFGLIIQSQRRFALPLSGLALDKNQGSCSVFTLPLPVSSSSFFTPGRKAFSSRSALCLPNR